MSRPPSPDLIRTWKVHVPASTAGKVEHLLFDRVSGKPYYGARARLLEGLLEFWLARETGAPLPHVPSATELLSGAPHNA